MTAVIIPAAEVEPYSPTAIIAVAAEDAKADAKLTPPDGCPILVHCYPEPEDTRDPLTPFGPDRGAGFAIAYVDKNFTAYVLLTDLDGKPIIGNLPGNAGPERISRLRAIPEAEQRIIPSIYLTPGAYPRSVNLYAITSLHVTKTLINFSQIAPLALVLSLAAARAAFNQALQNLDLLLQDRDDHAGKLIAAHKVVREGFDDVKHVGNVTTRDYHELRFLLARAQWHKAFLVARITQNAAIAAYNAMREADRIIERNPVRTEARIIDEAGTTVFPPSSEGENPPEE